MSAGPCATARTTNATTVTAEPATRGTFDPTVPESFPPIGLKIIIAIVVGIRNSPASVTDDPNPYPVDFGDCTYWGIRTKALYMPNPSNSAARFVVQTPRARIITMSTSGCLERISTHTQRTASTTAREI